MPAESSPGKDNGNGLLAATRLNAEGYRIILNFLLRLNQAYVTMVELMARMIGLTSPSRDRRGCEARRRAAEKRTAIETVRGLARRSGTILPCHPRSGQYVRNSEPLCLHIEPGHTDGAVRQGPGSR